MYDIQGKHLTMYLYIWQALRLTHGQQFVLAAKGNLHEKYIYGAPKEVLVHLVYDLCVP